MLAERRRKMASKLNIDMNKFIAQCLGDIQVELSQEFDQNFERQAFFSEKWQRRRYDPPGADRGILTQSGALRRSILSKIEGRRLIFTSAMPYSKIQNEGGAITVTPRMKAYFWYKYKEETKNLKGKAMTEAGAFYRAMALKRRGSAIQIPRRMFLGKSPEVEKIVREVAEDCLEEYFNHVNFLFK